MELSLSRLNRDDVHARGVGPGPHRSHWVWPADEWIGSCMCHYGQSSGGIYRIRVPICHQISVGRRGLLAGRKPELAGRGFKLERSECSTDGQKRQQQVRPCSFSKERAPECAPPMPSTPKRSGRLHSARPRGLRLLNLVLELTRPDKRRELPALGIALPFRAARCAWAYKECRGWSSAPFLIPAFSPECIDISIRSVDAHG